MTRSKDLQTCRFGVALYILQHLPAFLVVFWCVRSVSVLGTRCQCFLLSGSRWLVPALGRTWTQASPSQPGHRPILPSILRYHFFLPCLRFQLVVLPLSILPTLTILDTLASLSIYYRRLSGAMDLDMSSGNGTPQVQPQAQQQGDSQAPGPPAPSTSTSTSAGGVSFRR